MIILDTSFTVAFYNTRDENHQKAIKLMDEIAKGRYGKLYITDYIFDESITVVLIRLKSLSETIKIGESIRKSTELLEVETTDFEDAWKFFKRQEITRFSFTDCTTLGMMEKNEIKNIATFDEDFVKVKGINVIGAV